MMYMVLAAASQAQTSSTLPFNLIPTSFHKDGCNFEKDGQRKTYVAINTKTYQTVTACHCPVPGLCPVHNP